MVGNEEQTAFLPMQIRSAYRELLLKLSIWYYCYHEGYFILRLPVSLIHFEHFLELRRSPTRVSLLLHSVSQVAHFRPPEPQPVRKLKKLRVIQAEQKQLHTYTNVCHYTCVVPT